MKTGQIKTEPLVIEKTLNARIDKVWQALTDHEKMKQWYFDMESFKPEIGFEFQFYGEKDGKKFPHVCVITEVIPGKKLVHSWTYNGYPGESFVTFELFEEGDKTRLKLTHEGLESFPQDDGDFAKENFTAGWTHIIGISLKEFLEKV